MESVQWDLMVLGNWVGWGAGCSNDMVALVICAHKARPGMLTLDYGTFKSRVENDRFLWPSGPAGPSAVHGQFVYKLCKRRPLENCDPHGRADTFVPVVRSFQQPLRGDGPTDRRSCRRWLRRKVSPGLVRGHAHRHVRSYVSHAITLPRGPMGKRTLRGTHARLQEWNTIVDPATTGSDRSGDRRHGGPRFTFR